MVIKILLLVGLIRLLLVTDKPFLCSGIYAAVVLVFGLAFGGNFVAVLVSVVIVFVLASIYFFLLDRLDSGTVIWWIVAILGIAIGLV